MINITGDGRILPEGAVDVSLPKNMLSLCDDAYNRVRALDARLSSERIVSVGFDVSGVAIVLSGSLEAWVIPLEKLLGREFISAVPIMDGQYVLLMPKEGEPFIVHSLSVLASASSAHGRGMTVTHI